VTEQLPVPEWESDVVTADGATVHLRPMRPDDEQRVAEMFDATSDDSVYLRYFSPVKRATATRLEMDGLGEQGHVARVAVLGDKLVGSARYDLIAPAIAEVAFVVPDEQQGRGIATLLLEHLAAIARSQGIHTFVAETLASNTRMLGVFSAAGWPRRTRFDAGVVHTEFAIDPSPASLEVISEREHAAEAASMGRIMSPGSIAVLGASRTKGHVGNAVIENLVAAGFTGNLYAVNPNTEEILGLRSYPSIAAVPGSVDVAVVIRPAAELLEVVDECAAKGVIALVIISSGFAEAGDAGRELQRDLVTRARANGMRVVGPNCLGIANTSPDVRMNATFAPNMPPAGNVAFLSQSGGIGIELLSQADARGIGISEFVSVGNKSDVSGNDLLQHWEDDDRTDVILFYLESFGNPRKFARIARRIARKKPIVVLKSGRTPAGNRGASSHTAALASSDITVDALFRQAGVVRVDTMEELLQTAQVLATQPLPAGARLAIVSNVGGPGILAADASAGAGLEVDELPSPVQQALAAAATPASTRNPVDLGAAATPEQFARSVDIVCKDASVDAVLVLYAPPVVTNAEAVARAVAETVQASNTTKPIVACFLGRTDVAAELGKIPVFPYPEAAVRALGRAAELTRSRARPAGVVPVLEHTDFVKAREVVEHALENQSGACWLEADDADAVLRAVGLHTVDTRVVTDADGAVAAATEFGFPVAVKTAAPEIVHKTDVGGVHLGLADGDEVRRLYTEMTGRLGDPRAVVQRMVPPGAECIIGVTQDPLFGPLVLFGLGGVAAELLADRGLRMLPLTDVDADELVRSLRSSPLLFGYRGTPALDMPALEDALLRVAQLAQAVPEIAEMDLNPVIVSEHGITVVDAKMRCAPAALGPPIDLRRMRD
jgi:acetyl coenzyme A synthetase (ADP forming)-like protein